MNKDEMKIFKEGMQKGVEFMHKEVYGHWRHPSDMSNLRDGYELIKNLVDINIDRLKGDIAKLEKMEDEKESIDHLQNKIYSMRQALKFIIEQYNQIPQMNAEEVEKYEAMLEALT